MLIRHVICNIMKFRVQDKLLYANYLEQLGLVSMLEDEQVRIMSSRSSRRNVANTAYLSQSPCLPDINFG